MTPLKSHGPQTSASQFREWVMCGWLTAVEEERDLIAQKHPPQRIVIGFKLANNDGRVAKASTIAHVAKDFARSKRGLGLGIGAADQPNGEFDAIRSGCRNRPVRHPVRCSLGGSGSLGDGGG